MRAIGLDVQKHPVKVTAMVAGATGVLDVVVEVAKFLLHMH